MSLATTIKLFITLNHSHLFFLSPHFLLCVLSLYFFCACSLRDENFSLLDPLLNLFFLCLPREIEIWRFCLYLFPQYPLFINHYENNFFVFDSHLFIFFCLFGFDFGKIQSYRYALDDNNNPAPFVADCNKNAQLVAPAAAYVTYSRRQSTRKINTSAQAHPHMYAHSRCSCVI